MKMSVIMARRGWNFAISAGVVVLGLWTSAAPAMIYPLYGGAWHLSAETTTTVFAAHPAVLLIALVLFGDLADHIGRRNAMLLGLLSELAGVLFFVFAQDVWWLYVGRGLVGLGVALSFSPASAALVEFSKPSSGNRASVVTTTASATGIILAMLAGGALVQYAPLPLRLNFIVLGAAIVLVAIGAWRLPRHTRAETATRWRPRLPVIPRGLRRPFALAAAAVSSAFALGALVFSLGSQIAKQLTGSQNALLTGGMLAAFGAVIGLASLASAKLTPRAGIVLGSLFGAGIWLFAIAGMTHLFALFLVACAASGAGYSLMFQGGVQIIARRAPEHHRAGMFSAGYLAAYVVQGLFAVALGMLATRSGLASAIETGAIALTVLFGLTFTLATLRGSLRLPIRDAQPSAP
jgi:predicted MFS family arabinose efflux permease